jgi:hypothetical protein
MLYHVPAHDIHEAWLDVKPMLAKATIRSDGDFTPHDVFKDLVMNNMQLFIWRVNGKIEAACVVQIYIRNNKKICSMPLIAGKSMQDWLKVEDQLIKFAKQQGCCQLEGYCRDGWLRVLKNWRKVWTTMRRDI